MLWANAACLPLRAWQWDKQDITNERYGSTGCGEWGVESGSLLWGLSCPVQGKLIKGERSGERLGEKAGEAVVGHGEEAGQVGLCIPRSFCPRAEVDTWKHLLSTILLANGLKKSSVSSLF